jgi:SAM-dependent methyltransferase
MTEPAVIWHDLECGAYRADLTLWLELAAARASSGAILEVGAGTGRVALELARAGNEVVALERDPLLARELERRADGLQLEVVLADACDFELDRSVALCVAAMQTIQLLEDRDGFLRSVRRALADGGLLAAALLAANIQPFEIELTPDVVERDGVRYASTPTALRRRGDRIVIERRRTAEPDRAAAAALDVVELARLEPDQLVEEARTAGFRDAGRLSIAATEQHAGSVVVLLEALAR